MAAGFSTCFVVVDRTFRPHTCCHRELTHRTGALSAVRSRVEFFGGGAGQRYFGLDVGPAHSQPGETYPELGFREWPIEPENLVQASVIVEDRESLLAVNGHAEYCDLHEWDTARLGR